jgi:hypothetical protein
LEKTIPTAGTNSAWNTGDEINSIQIHIVHHERPPEPKIGQKPDLELPAINVRTLPMGESR